jgi:GNAT superfamily N-acetyltransferase
VHAFLRDTLVASEFRRRGLATAIVEDAARQARAAGCDWLHVDFRKTDAGIMALR